MEVCLNVRVVDPVVTQLVTQRPAISSPPIRTVTVGTVV
jgi:hypothetical protein